MKLKLFYLIGKSVTLKTRILGICGLLLFLTYPMSISKNLYNEYKVSKSYFLSEGKITSIRNTFIIFKIASVSFQLNEKKYYKNIIYMPFLEVYNVKQNITLRINPNNHFSTFNKPSRVQ